MSVPDVNRAAYDAIAERWYAGPRRCGAEPYLHTLLERLAPGARVLDVGCGTGVPIARGLTRRGFRVVGIDTSARMLRIARDEVPAASFVQADMGAIALTGRFAAAVAWDSIFHVDRAAHRAVFRGLAALLEPGAALLLSAGGTAHAGFGSEMFGHTFFYSGYAPERTAALLRAEGFAIDSCGVDDPSSGGHVATLATRQ